jgi:hypothetical protein
MATQADDSHFSSYIIATIVILSVAAFLILVYLVWAFFIDKKKNPKSKIQGVRKGGDDGGQHGVSLSDEDSLQQENCQDRPSSSELSDPSLETNHWRTQHPLILTSPSQNNEKQSVFVGGPNIKLQDIQIERGTF